MRYKVTWNGVVYKTIAVENPADALYHIWQRFREDFAGGTIDVGIDEGGRGVRLAQLSFPVRIAREIEAENPAEAVRAFSFDDRLPSCFDAASIEVVAIDDPFAPGSCPV